MATINVYSPFNETVPEGNARVAVQYGTDRTVNVGVQRATPDPMSDGLPTYDADSGKWCELNRDGCNALIRALREARDRAYGKDE